MPDQVIGSCSICGGDVVGHTGPWWGTQPPPPARCTSCGATQARGPVIKMVPRNVLPFRHDRWGSCGCSMCANPTKGPW